LRAPLSPQQKGYCDGRGEGFFLLFFSRFTGESRCPVSFSILGFRRENAGEKHQDFVIPEMPAGVIWNPEYIEKQLGSGSRKARPE
jgi:hypothetical protein